jgi:hypothetical protein
MVLFLFMVFILPFNHRPVKNYFPLPASYLMFVYKAGYGSNNKINNPGASSKLDLQDFNHKAKVEEVL